MLQPSIILPSLETAGRKAAEAVEPVEVAQGLPCQRSRTAVLATRFAQMGHQSPAAWGPPRASVRVWHDEATSGNSIRP